VKDRQTTVLSRIPVGAASYFFYLQTWNLAHNKNVGHALAEPSQVSNISRHAISAHPDLDVGISLPTDLGFLRHAKKKAKARKKSGGLHLVT
jgi:hypothetical protein